MDVLYKYRPFSARALEMLIKRQVYFAAADKLNDPYDCRISIRQALADAITGAESSGNQALQDRLQKLRKIDHVYERIEKDVGAVGVLSLVTCPTNVVIWAHYAENHRGFCARFRFSEKFTTHRNDEQIVGLDQVVYSAGNPFSDFFAEFAAAKEPPSWDEFWQSLLSISMVAKAEPWSYEGEVRIMRRSSGLVSFAPSELVEIVLGMNMHDSERSTLRQLLVGAEWSHVRFKEIVRSEGFAVRLEDAAI